MTKNIEYKRSTFVYISERGNRTCNSEISLTSYSVYFQGLYAFTIDLVISISIQENNKFPLHKVYREG